MKLFERILPLYGIKKGHSDNPILWTTADCQPKHYIFINEYFDRTTYTLQENTAKYTGKNIYTYTTLRGLVGKLIKLGYSRMQIIDDMAIKEQGANV